MSAWYYVQEGRRQGPVSLEFVVDELRRGRLATQDRVWTAGLDNWVAIDEVPEILEAWRNAPPPLPVADEAEPVAAEPATAALVYATVPVRAAAMMIDVAINALPLLILLYIVVAAMNVPFDVIESSDSEQADKVRLVFQLCAWPWLLLYNAAFESSSLQATPGKLAMGLRVCGVNGERLGPLRASWRFFWKNTTLLFGFILALSFPWIGYTSPKRQTLHDIFAQSVVVVKQPVAEKKENEWTSA